VKTVRYEGARQVSASDQNKPKWTSPTEALLCVTTSASAAVISGRAKPSCIVSHDVRIDDAPYAYEKFDHCADGYTKVLIQPHRPPNSRGRRPNLKGDWALCTDSLQPVG
jgi:hypothetical protein